MCPCSCDASVREPVQHEQKKRELVAMACVCSLQKTCRPQLAFGVVSGRPPLPNLRGPLLPRPQACKGKASRTESLKPSFARSGFKVRACFRDRNEDRFWFHNKCRFSVSPL